MWFVVKTPDAAAPTPSTPTKNYTNSQHREIRERERMRNAKLGCVVLTKERLGELANMTGYKNPGEGSSSDLGCQVSVVDRHHLLTTNYY
jgi:hypothetical protein